MARILKYGGLLLLLIGAMMLVIKPGAITLGSGGILAVGGWFAYREGKRRTRFDDEIDATNRERIVMSKDVQRNLASVIDIITRKCPGKTIYGGECSCGCQFLYTAYDISYETKESSDVLEGIVRCPDCHAELIHNDEAIIRDA